MKKNFVKKLAVALSLAMAVSTLAPAANADAAAAPKFKSTSVTVNAGQTKKYNTANSKKYSVSFKIGNKSVATIKYSKGSKAVKVTGVTAGKTTLRADFKSYSTKKVTTKKIPVTVKAVTVAIKGDNNFATAVDEKYTLTAELSGKTSATVAWSVAEEGATIGADGVFTATKAGEYTVTATAKAGDNTVATATQKVTVKEVVLKSVAQTKSAALKAIFAGDTSKVTRENVLVENKDTKAVLPVKSVSVSKTNKNEVTITTFAGMTDGKEYAVTFDGVSASFIATDGTVAGLGIDPVVITKATETVITGQLLDVNGVVVDEFDYLKNPAKVDFNITVTNGYTTTDSKLYLNEVGDTATAKLTYHTYKWDEQGNETGKIEKEFTITAVADATVVDDFRYTISGSQSAPNWSNLSKTNSKISVEETTQQYAHFRFTDSNDVPVTGNYTVESSDTSKLLISGPANTVLPITAVAEGNAYILVKNADGQVVKYLPVTVVAERKGVRLSVNTPSVILSEKNASGSAINVTATMFDQYGDERAIDGTKSNVATVVSPNAAVSATCAVTNGKLTVTFDGTTAGWVDGTTYTFKVDAYDINGNKASQIITVIYRLVGAATGNQYAVVLGGVEAGNKVDVYVPEGTTTTDYAAGLNLTVQVAAKQNGAFVSNCALTSVTITKPNGTTVAASVSGTTGTYALTNVSGGAIVVKNVVDGTYKVTANYSDTSGAAKTATAYFTVTGVDKQEKPSVKYLHDGEVIKITSANTVTGAVQDSTNVIKFTYGDADIPGSDISVENAGVVFNANGKDVFVKYVLVNVPVSNGVSGLKVQVKVPLNKTFSFSTTPSL